MKNIRLCIRCGVNVEKKGKGRAYPKYCQVCRLLNSYNKRAKRIQGNGRPFKATTVVKRYSGMKWEETIQIK